MKKTLKEYFIEISALRKQYRDWLRGRIDNLQNSTPQVALALEVSKSVLAAIDSLSDDLSYRTEILAERQEKRQTEIDLLNANITALRVAVSDIAQKTMQTKSFEVRLMKIEGREEKTQRLQESFEHFVEKKSEEIKKQDEKRRQDAEKSLPGVT
ncbi:MAG: hypothetical protein FIO02_06965 [Nitrosopumilales archaeon]|jgi:hypothetical protein|nr:hypothetical protein [Nitrosopumilales archaeon]